MMPERAIVSILKQIAAEGGIECRVFSNDWVVRLQRGDATRWVFGYDFDLNSCCAQQLAKDKAASSLALGLAELPCIEHALFSSPQFPEFAPESGGWRAILEYAERHDFNLVCKPNEGTGGEDLMHVQTPIQLERVVHRLFGRFRTIAICPYVAIENEYRVIVLRGACLLAYRKLRPALRGDGVSSRLALLARLLGETGDRLALTKAVQELVERRADLSAVVPKGETWLLNWKHNLGLGAGIELIGDDFPRKAEIERLALGAARALGLQFASVDVIETHSAAPAAVLEVNAGVMMEALAAKAPGGRALATSVYRAAVDAMFSR